MGLARTGQNRRLNGLFQMTPSEIERAAFIISEMRCSKEPPKRIKQVMAARRELEDRHYSPAVVDEPDKPTVRILMSWLNEAVKDSAV